MFSRSEYCGILLPAPEPTTDKHGYKRAMGNILEPIDLWLSSGLEHKQANKRASFDWGPTATQFHKLKFLLSFQIFIIFRLVLWISSSLWLNVESGLFLKVMLVIQQRMKEIYIFDLTKSNTEKCNIVLCPHSPLNHSPSTGNVMYALVTLK